MNKLLIICGPTATGKTALGISLAKQFRGEVVSADSRQVYIGMDVATGKDLPVNAKIKMKNEKLQIKIKNSQILKPYRFENIPVWLLDIVRPNQEFSAANFVNLADIIIDDVHRRNKLPIVVGGTGFYIKALIDGIETLGVPPDWELRKSLQNKSMEELFEMLARLDGERAASMNSSDRKNPRRLIRVIEVALKFKNQILKIKKTKKKLKMNLLMIGLTAQYKKLYKSVDERIEEQLKAGSESEVRKLLAQGYSWDLPAMSAMGYGVWRDCFEKKTSFEETIQKWKFEEHAYVRRQMTWFKKDKRINWFDITNDDWMHKVEEKVKNWYNRSI